MTRCFAQFRFTFRLAILALAVFAPAARPQEQPTQPTQATQQRQPWDLGARPANWNATSNLVIENRCRRSHRFDVLMENLPFMQFLAETHNVDVKGRSAKSLPVRFDTKDLQPGEFNGQVIVKCLDCRTEPTCTQDKEILPVHVTISGMPVPQATRFACNVRCASCTGGITHDCSELLNRIDALKGQLKQAEGEYDRAGADAQQAGLNVLVSLNAAGAAMVAAWNNYDVHKTAEYSKQVEQANTQATAALAELDKADKALDAAGTRRDQFRSALAAALRDYHNCLAQMQVCKQENAPHPCTGNEPCTSGGVTPCMPDKPCTSAPPCTAENPCTPCTPLQPCTSGQSAARSVPQTMERTVCMQTQEDCDDLGSKAARLEAVAQALQAAANGAKAAAADAQKAAQAADAAAQAPRDKAGEAAQNAAAAQAVANAASANADKAQAQADAARAAADAARRAYQNCPKLLQQACGGGAGGPGGGAAGGAGPGGVLQQAAAQEPCPPEDCDKLKKAWEEAKTRAAIAQALADQAAANQGWNNGQAAALDDQAASDKKFADHMTAVALKWLDLAADAERVAAQCSQRAKEWPAGSSIQADWNAEAARWKEKVKFYNEQYDRLEAEEREYDARAAQATAQAVALRDAANAAQAAAAAANAAAAAAEKAYKDCLECEKQKTASTPTTPTPPTPTPPTGGGGKTGTTPPTGGTPPTGITPQDQPQVGGTTPDYLGHICKKGSFLAGGAVVSKLRSRPPGLTVGTEGRAGGLRITFHCQVDNGIFTITYETEDGSVMKTVQCSP